MPSAVPYHRSSDNESDSGSDGQPDQTGFAVFSRDASIDELDAEDFPSYFNEVDGRLYHSSPTCPYPLPVDGPEQERLNTFNSLVRQLIGANYVGPVPNILARDPDRQSQVLDLCTGTGTWLMDIAMEFPQVLFTGIDVVPIATRYPLPNVNFEIGDISEEFRWPDATFDFIHARSIFLAVHDYTTILPEVTRVMRQGGLYLSGELAFNVYVQSNHSQASDTPPSTPAFDRPPRAPASSLFFQVLHAALQTRGLGNDVSQIPTFLQSTGAFHGIASRTFWIPIGNWPEDPRMKELGRIFQAILCRFSDSVKSLLRQAGHTQEYVEALVQSFNYELERTHGLVGAYYVVQAIKN